METQHVEKGLQQCFMEGLGSSHEPCCETHRCCTQESLVFMCEILGMLSSRGTLWLMDRCELMYYITVKDLLKI